MKSRMVLKAKFWLCIFSCAMLTGVNAAEVTSAQAQTAVKNWVRKNPRAMNGQFRSNAGGVQTLSNALGRVLCHVIELDGGGFVVTSGDTKISPVIAFSDSGTFMRDPHSPLFAMLQRDMAARVRTIDAADAPVRKLMRAAASATAAVSSSTEGVDMTETLTASEIEWNQLLAEESPSKRRVFKAVTSTSGLSDVYVAPLVKTLWDQDTWGKIPDGLHAFNWNLPSCPCGCVATAAAQVMKMFEYPQTSLPQATFDCTLEGKDQPYSMKGGTYDWKAMPLKWTDTLDITEAQAKAIGKLTWDAGVSCGMNFTANNSTTAISTMRERLLDTFGFKSAEYADVYLWNKALEEQVFLLTCHAMLASLDAGMPVFGGIFVFDESSGASGGHCILFDGYGELSSALYVHMNCGYSGIGDIWYRFFEENLVNPSKFSEGLLDLSGNGSAAYNFLASILYNAHPTQRGDVISGRVYDPAGKFVSGATVRLYDASGNVVQTTSSNERGIYYFRVADAGTNLLRAEKKISPYAYASQQACVIREQKSITPTGADDMTCIGNRWGVNLVLEPKPLEQVKTPTFDPKNGSYTGNSVSVRISCGTTGATIHYTTDGSLPTESSPVYASAIQVTGTRMIRAIACKSGMADSEVAFQKYEQNVFKGASDLAAAVDCPGIDFSADQVSCVAGQTAATFDGVDALAFTSYGKRLNGFVSMATSPILTATLSGPGTLRFMGKCVSCSYGLTSLACSLDGTSKASVRSEDWEEGIVTIGSGSHTVTWTFSGLGSQDTGVDVGYLDQVTWTSGSVSKMTVSYSKNGAESGSLTKTSDTAYPGEKVTLPTGDGLTREGYLFGGWNTEPDGSGKSYWKGAKFTVGEKDVTLYAKWCKIVDVPFDYPAAGGSHTFDLSEFSGTYFHGIGEFPSWASFGARDENGNIMVGAGFSSLLMQSGLKICISVIEANPDKTARPFSWILLSEECQTAPRFVCTQQGDVSHLLSAVTLEGPASIVGGASATLSCTGLYRDGTREKMPKATWSIKSGTAYATVASSTGVLTAKPVSSAGTVTVSASYGGYSATLDVKVLPAIGMSAALGSAAAVSSTGTGSTEWRAQKDVTNGGEAALCCGSCLNDTPWFEFSLAAGQVIDFDCRMSAGAGRTLSVLDNGVQVDYFRSLVDYEPWWHVRHETSDDRAHTIRVVYKWTGSRTGSESETDRAWIDSVRIRDAGGECSFSFAKKGWHRVSFNALPDDRSPASVFAAVKSQVASVSECGGSAYWTPAGGDLTALAIGRVYWVETNADGVNLTVEGAMEPDVAIALKKGWNCIGYPLAEAVAPEIALKTALDGRKITSIGLAGRSEFYPGGGLGTMEPGQVYWVEAPADAVISYDVK